MKVEDYDDCLLGSSWRIFVGLQPITSAPAPAGSLETWMLSTRHRVTIPSEVVFMAVRIWTIDGSAFLQNYRTPPC